MITINIDVSKIDKAHLYEGKKGKYLSVLLHDRPDDYGNDGFAAQGVTKEAREKGVKGPIIGNWKTLGTRTNSKPAKTESKPKSEAKPVDESEDNSIPF